MISKSQVNQKTVQKNKIIFIRNSKLISLTFTIVPATQTNLSTGTQSNCIQSLELHRWFEERWFFCIWNAFPAPWQIEFDRSLSLEIGDHQSHRSVSLQTAVCNQKKLIRVPTHHWISYFWMEWIYSIIIDFWDLKSLNSILSKRTCKSGRINKREIHFSKSSLRFEVDQIEVIITQPIVEKFELEKLEPEVENRNWFARMIRNVFLLALVLYWSSTANAVPLENLCQDAVFHYKNLHEINSSPS